ncbi:MAG: hypothetical protein HY517_00750 [Candidatus Aenigmarchaeota archaeon]|nr:hypothetical protein [Candidatus Aenigmarchaeota archaeon]
MAVVDSSVIIHLARIGKLNLLQACLKKIKISTSIEQEITKDKTGADEIRACIGKWIEVKKIKFHARETGFLSAADIELIELAKKEKDFVLTNDEEIISSAKSRGVETMWLTTFLLLCLKKKLVDKKEAKQILYDLTRTGCYIRTDTFVSVQRQIEEM